MGRLFAVEIIYRGIFQKKLATNLSRAIVLAAHKEGKPGISFGRYGDSPERNGIPAKGFAIVATDDLTLEEGMAKYEPKEVDVTIVVDDTLLKGVESWAWYGLQPANRLLKPDGALIVTSLEAPEALIPMLHRKDQPYRLAALKATPSFSGLWVYKDDHTDVRILGAIAKLLPDLFSLTSLQEVIGEEWHDPLKQTSALRAYERVSTVTVQPSQGNPETPYKFDFPKWHEMRDGIAIPNIPLGAAVADPATGQSGGYRPARNPTFKKYLTRTMRPVIDFEKCVKCTLCWLQCPDSVFDVMPDGTYDADMEACCGCGVCEAVCPEPECVTMVNESHFNDNASQWQAWRKDPGSYDAWARNLVALRRGEDRSHGFRFRGQYQQQVPGVLATAGETDQAVSGAAEPQPVAEPTQPHP
jgi:pyruvate ferredoxin oxidoreductase delta subunit